LNCVELRFADGEFAVTPAAIRYRLGVMREFSPEEVGQGWTFVPQGPYGV
jgi:hypothetical protein